MQKITVKTAFVTIVLLMTFFSTRCESPFHFKPHHDSLTAAPDPPKITRPLPETTLWYFNPPFWTQFEWNNIQGTENYELDIDITLEFNSPPSLPCKRFIIADSSPISIRWDTSQVLPGRNYYYRLRALSSKWLNGYTNWSTPAWFILQKNPGSPRPDRL